jgi:crotonobetainyl-CoA:carnitine CoA-transferase CaiB-like acyl-CoA transferase
VQWSRLTSIDGFGGLASPARVTNEGRRQERDAIHRGIDDITRGFQTRALVDLLSSKGLVIAPIHTVPQAIEYPAIRHKLLETKTPGGVKVRLPPPAVEHEHLAAHGRRLAYAPGYAEHTDIVLREIGIKPDEITRLRNCGTVA